ncbi:MAG TPA: DPP IV N-terminal domain-containing protein [Urbifossiella sp.]
MIRSHSQRSMIWAFTALAAGMLSPQSLSAQGTKADYARALGYRQKTANKVYRAKVEPNWIGNGDRFWYRNDLPGGKKEFVLVDAVKGTREVVAEDMLPKEGFAATRNPRSGTPPWGDGISRQNGPDSPDGKWSAFIKDSNVWLRDRKTKSETPLSTNGREDNNYGAVYWSPDSKRLIAIRTRAGGDRRVTIVESSPRDQLQPRTMTYGYLKPGDKIPQARPHLFDIDKKQEIPVADDLFPNPWSITHHHWSPDSKRFFFLYNQRGHTVMRVIAMDAKTGHTEAIVNEECKTFFDYNSKLYLRYLDAANELLWMSERSGWNHLYRIDSITGKVKNPVTKGEWVLRGVDQLDEKTGELTLRVLGVYKGQDPCQIHYAKVKLDGSGFTLLTEGDGTHAATFSPDRRFLIDTWSRPDSPPITELRTAAGKKVCDLETADITAWKHAGGVMSERFTARGRDGETDIYGLIFRPSNFDPNKTYRVIESIYAGPHDQHVLKRFSPAHYEQPMAELGFIVVKIDGMGTNWRSKAFHDICWKNLGDAGFPDRIKWIKAAAARHPEMDIARGVGIYGGSAGGQNTVRGMTEYPNFYVAGVSDCGCHDNRMDKIWWNELWMSWPIGPHYTEQSNVTNAHKITGKLMLVVGELDRNVDPASTLQVVNALIKADRDFELLIVPGVGHGSAESPYGNRRRMDFFVRNLMGVEPRVK